MSLLASTDVSPYGENSVGLLTLGGTGTAVSSTNQLPGGQGGPYSVTAHYAGDGTYAPSDSNASLGSRFSRTEHDDSFRAYREFPG